MDIDVTITILRAITTVKMAKIWFECVAVRKSQSFLGAQAITYDMITLKEYHDWSFEFS
jgi:hypothetical protein